MADDQKTEQAAEEVIPPEAAQLRSLEAPWFYASTFRIQATGNDFHLILQRGSPAQNPDGSVHPTLGRLETVAVLTLSPQATKDLSVLLAQQIKSHEDEFGTIETVFTKRRTAEQKAKP